MTYVLVTTKHRGVFAGYLSDDQDHNDRTLVLTDCRCAIYWAGQRGFLGLAAHGPEESSRIGATAPHVRLHDVTSVSHCTETAERRWTKWPDNA